MSAMILLTSGSSNVAGTTFYTSRIVPTTGRMIVAAVCVSPSAATVTSVTGCGIGSPTNSVGSPVTYGTAGALYVFAGLCHSYIYDNVKITCSAATSGVTWAIFDATALQVIGPTEVGTFYQVKAAHGDGFDTFTSTLPLAAADTANPTIMVVASDVGAPTPSSGWSTLVNVVGTGLSTYLGVYYSATPLITFTGTFGVANSLAYIHCELAAKKQDRIIKQGVYRSYLEGTLKETS